MRSLAVQAPPRLQIYCGERRLFARAFDKEVVTLGSHPTCDVVLEGDDVSQLHATIERSPTGLEYTVRDLCFIGSTYLNGARVWNAALHMGDVIRIGEFQIRFEWNPPTVIDTGDLELPPEAEPVPLTKLKTPKVLERQ
jgi:predicted component of type VI protein secretion system